MNNGTAQIGFLDLQCIARQDTPTAHTLYGIAFGVRRVGTGEGEGEEFLLLVKSNESPKSTDDVSWTLVDVIQRQSLHYLRASPLKMLCAVDEAGSFTMMTFDTTMQPFVTRYDPGVVTNGTQTAKGNWWNAVIAINYRWEMSNSYLFTVPRASTSNNQTAVYHAFVEDNNMLGFGYLNLVSRAMETVPVSWDLTSYSKDIWVSAIEVSDDTLYLIGAPKSNSFPMIFLELPFSVKTSTAPPQPKSFTSDRLSTSLLRGMPLFSTSLNNYYFGLIDIGGSELLTFDGATVTQLSDFQRPYGLMFMVALPGNSIDEVLANNDSIEGRPNNSPSNTTSNIPSILLFEQIGDSDIYHTKKQALRRISFNRFLNATVTTWGPGFINLTGDYDISRPVPTMPVPPQPPFEGSESFDVVPVATGGGILLILLVFGACFWRWRRTRRARKVSNLEAHAVDGRSDGDGGKGRASSTIDEAELQKQPENDMDEHQMLGKMEKEEVAGFRRRDWARTGRPKEEDGESVPTSTTVGRPVAAPSVPISRIENMSSSIRKSVPGETRQRRQMIVLASHPRPNIITTIDQDIDGVEDNDDAEERREGNEDEEYQGPPEEWIPKPFNPQEQTNPSMPQTLSTSVSGRSLAQPSAPPATVEATEAKRHSVADTIEDIDESLPSYEDNSSSQV